MTTAFPELAALPTSGRATALLIDHQRYAQAIILQGQPVPWSDPDAYAQFHRQAQALLRPDLTLLDLGAFFAHRLATDDSLPRAMAARSRTGYGLRALLTDEATTAAAVTLAGVVAQTCLAPLAVQIPAPMSWLATTHVAAGAGEVAELDTDDAENAAVRIADWCRALSDLPISLLILDDRPPAATGLPVIKELPVIKDEAYVPIENVARHYRWTLARRRDEEIFISEPSMFGAVVPDQYWLDGAVIPNSAVIPDGDFRLADIPADAVPETVLDRLTGLR